MPLFLSLFGSRVKGSICHCPVLGVLTPVQTLPSWSGSILHPCTLLSKLLGNSCGSEFGGKWKGTNSFVSGETFEVVLCVPFIPREVPKSIPLGPLHVRRCSCALQRGETQSQGTKLLPCAHIRATEGGSFPLPHLGVSACWLGQDAGAVGHRGLLSESWPASADAVEPCGTGCTTLPWHLPYAQLFPSILVPLPRMQR